MGTFTHKNDPSFYDYDDRNKYFPHFSFIRATVEVACNGDVQPYEEGEWEETHDHTVDGEHVQGVVRVSSKLCSFWIRRPGQQDADQCGRSCAKARRAFAEKFGLERKF